MSEKTPREGKNEGDDLKKVRRSVRAINRARKSPTFSKKGKRDFLSETLHEPASEREMPEVLEQKAPSLHPEDEAKRKQADMEIDLLEKNYKNTVRAMENADMYSRPAMQITLDRIERRINEIAEEAGLEKTAVFAKIHEQTAEDLKKTGRAKLDRLEAALIRHEIDLYNDPEAQERFYEFEHDARRIIESYGLPSEHLAPFTERTAKAKAAAETRAVAEQKASEPEIASTIEQVPQKERGFFKKLFGLTSKEEKLAKKQAEERAQNLSIIDDYADRYAEMKKLVHTSGSENHNLESVKAALKANAFSAYNRLSAEDKKLPGPQRLYGLLDEGENPLAKPINPEIAELGKGDRFTVTPETRAEKIKRYARKAATILLYTLASTTTNPFSKHNAANPEKQAEDIEFKQDLKEVAKMAAKADVEAFMKAHTKLEIERKAPKHHNKAPAKHTEHAQTESGALAERVQENHNAAPTDTLTALRETKDSARHEMLTPVKVDTARTVENGDSGTSTKPEKAVKTKREAKKKIEKVSIDEISLTGLQKMKTDTINATGPLINRIRNLDAIEKARDASKPALPAEAQLAQNESFPTGPKVVATLPKQEQSSRLEKAEDQKNLTPGKGKITVEYQDEEGKALPTETVEKDRLAAENRAKVQRDSVETKKEKQQVATPEETARLFTQYQEAIKTVDWTSAKSYEPALQTIINSYNLNTVTAPWHMEPKIQLPEDMTAVQRGIVQQQFVTRGRGEHFGKNFVVVLTSSLEYANKNPEKFAIVVRTMFHEYIHGWQRSSANMNNKDDHTELEVQAHYFTLFPWKYSEWRRANFTPTDENGNVTGVYPEVPTVFPEIPDKSKLWWGAQFKEYYEQLDLSQMTPKMRAMYEEFDSSTTEMINALPNGNDRYLESRAQREYFKAHPEELAQYRKDNFGYDIPEGADTIKKAGAEIMLESSKKFETFYAEMQNPSKETRAMHEKSITFLNEGYPIAKMGEAFFRAFPNERSTELMQRFQFDTSKEIPVVEVSDAERLQAAQTFQSFYEKLPENKKAEYRDLQERIGLRVLAALI